MKTLFKILVVALLALVLLPVFPVQAATPTTLVGTLSWGGVERRHVEIATSSGPWALVGATSTIQTTLEAGADAGKRAWVRGHVAEASIFFMPTLIVYQVRVCPQRKEKGGKPS